MTFWTHWRKPVVSEGSTLLEWLIEVKTWTYYIFDLMSHVIAKNGNVSEEIADRWQNNSFCQTNMSPGHYKVLERKTLPNEKFSFIGNNLLSIFKLVLQVTYYFLMSCLLTHNQLSWNALLFPCNLICHLCLGGSGGYSRCTVTCPFTLTPFKTGISMFFTFRCGWLLQLLIC